MRTLSNYLDAAKQKTGIKTDMELNFTLGYKGLQVSNMRTGRTLVSDDMMIKIAEMADVSKECALIDLNIWRSKGTPAEEVYKAIARMMPSWTIKP